LPPAPTASISGCAAREMEAHAVAETDPHLRVAAETRYCRAVHDRTPIDTVNYRELMFCR